MRVIPHLGLVVEDDAMVFMNEPAALVKLRRSALHDYRTAPMFEALNKFTSILPQDTGRGSHVLDLGLRYVRTADLVPSGS